MKKRKPQLFWWACSVCGHYDQVTRVPKSCPKLHCPSHKRPMRHPAAGKIIRTESGAYYRIQEDGSRRRLVS